MDLKRRARNEQRIFEGLQGKFSERPVAALEADNRFLLPRIKEIFAGNTGLQFYANPIISAARTRPVRVLSLGSGDGDVEFGLASMFRDAHVDTIRLDAIELSEHLVERCNLAAQQDDMARGVNFYQQDINALNMDGEYDFVIANQILHHVVALEDLFDNVSRILGRDGLLMTRDMIGKNGHQAWPEALEIIDSIWADMPDQYKLNHRDGQHYERFPNRDFSVDCFEGVRSQDVLANITSHFEFKAFYAYGGIFERFVNRGWGHNYSFDNKEDERFMTHLQNLNDELLDNGKITPTQMAGYFQRSFKNGRCWKSRTPATCIRP